jgi:hypothetical protein
VLGTGANDVALGSAQRSTSLVRIPSALAADLVLLTEALDMGAVDIAATLLLLSSDVATAVSSYAGLSVRVVSADSHADLTTLDDPDVVARIVTSLRIPVPAASPATGSSAAIVLYATMPGAFVDLAADLAWLTDLPLDDVGLDVDLGARLDAHPESSLRSRSSIDQAIGLLVGRGHTPEEALVELEALATRVGGDRYVAAQLLLAALPARGVEFDTQ